MTGSAITFCRATLLTLLSVLANSPAQADLIATDFWSRATPPAAETGAVYGRLQNNGTVPLTVTGVETAASESAQIHRSMSRDGMMSMEHVPRVRLEPGQELRLEPGGLHIMLVGLKYPLEQGSTFEIGILAQARLSEASVPQHSSSGTVSSTATVMVGGIGQMEPPATDCTDCSGRGSP